MALIWVCYLISIRTLGAYICWCSGITRWNRQLLKWRLLLWKRRWRLLTSKSIEQKLSLHGKTRTAGTTSAHWKTLSIGWREDCKKLKTILRWWKFWWMDGANSQCSAEKTIRKNRHYNWMIEQQEWQNATAISGKMEKLSIICYRWGKVFYRFICNTLFL